MTSQQHTRLLALAPIVTLDFAISVGLSCRNVQLLLRFNEEVSGSQLLQFVIAPHVLKLSSGFSARTNAEQRQHAKTWKAKTGEARKAFFREFATRNSELLRLPYFDICRMVVIDPMHNLFLGMFTVALPSHS